MHPVVQQAFRRIIETERIAGDILEVGAIPNSGSLLYMPCLRHCTRRIGINLDGPHEMEGFSIVKGNANSMTQFEDNEFDAVLCNAVLNYDIHFWHTVSEMRRVLKPGGLLVVGVNGFTYYQCEKARGVLYRLPLLRRLYDNSFFNLFFQSTLTMHVIRTPTDYYRFSADSMREVLLAGLDVIDVKTIMAPPRIIGYARKPISA